MWEMSTMERRYSVPPSSTLSDPSGRYRTTEDLHAWSIYRQNLNSDFTDSALDTGHKSQPPFGDFRLRESTVHTILNHPKYGPRERQSELAGSVATYLRFGLPRVVPPSAPSRARSDPDFRNGLIPPRGNLKANSEADLLADRSDSRSQSRQEALRSRGEDYKRHPMPTPHSNGHAPPPGSHLSVGSRPPSHIKGEKGGFYGDAPPILNERFFPKDSFYQSVSEGNGTTTKYPHLLVRDLTYEMDMSSAWQTMCGVARTKLRLLDGLGFEARGGEILAIMATAEEEGTALLDILANRHRRWRCTLRGAFSVNGLPLPPRKLSRCVAYVQRHADASHPDMSVRQSLLFTSLLQEPDAERGFDAKSRINALIEDLGLAQVKHTRVSDLTESEKRRLNVATQLLLDTDIVLLDQPTRGMDIFDTFFLVEYLRQWAARGRIVLLTIHPPTYEIFTMISRVAVISTGRMLYFGKRRDMLPYFAYIDFPCPAYKNPSDYYLDLVTLDNLSAEAMLESSQRVENLVEVYRRRHETLPEPGPPGVPPATYRRAGTCAQILALWIRVLIYTFPFNVVHFCGQVCAAALMSVVCGAIYWSVRTGRDQQHLLDRLGFYWVMAAVAIWPLLLANIANAWKEKATVVRDTRERLYHKSTYVFCKLTYSLLPAALIALAYAVPAYSMAGLQPTSRVRPFGTYMVAMILYILTLRMGALAAAWLFSSRHLAAWVYSLLLMLMCLPTGFNVLHAGDVVNKFFRWISPVHWLYRLLVQNDFLTETDDVTRYGCARNPVIAQEETAILMRAECGLTSPREALDLFQLSTEYPLWQPLVRVVVFHAVCLIVGVVSFLVVNHSRKSKRKERTQ